MASCLGVERRSKASSMRMIEGAVGGRAGVGGARQLDIDVRLDRKEREREREATETTARVRSHQFTKEAAATVITEGGCYGYR